MVKQTKGLMALALVALTPVGAHADQVVVFAAASLKGPLDAVAAGFQAETGHQVLISYAGSNTLARQIIQGAPATVLVSAAPEWLDAVEAEGLIVPKSRRDLLRNELVLVAHGTSTGVVRLGPELDLAGLLAGGKLSLADVQSVPAGQYAKAALEHFGLWDAVQPHVVQSDNVRAALAFVALGEAPLGIVYASDARTEPRVSLVAHFPPDSHPPIRYSAGLITGADDVSRAFFQALSDDAADAIFAEAGFQVLQ